MRLQVLALVQQRVAVTETLLEFDLRLPEALSMKVREKGGQPPAEREEGPERPASPQHEEEQPAGWTDSVQR